MYLFPPLGVVAHTHHGVGGVEDVQEPTADGLGQEVVLAAVVPGTDPPQSQEHREWRPHAEEILNLKCNQFKSIIR